MLGSWIIQPFFIKFCAFINAFILIFFAAIPLIFIVSQFRVEFILISFWLPISQFISVSVSEDYLKFLFVFSNFITFISVFSNSIAPFSLNLPLLIYFFIPLISYFIPLISVSFLALISSSQLFYSQLTVILTVKLELSSLHLLVLLTACSLLSLFLFSSFSLPNYVTSLFLYLSIIFSLFHYNYPLFFGTLHFRHRIFDLPIILRIYYDNLHILCGPILVMIELGSLGFANNIFCNTIHHRISIEQAYCYHRHILDITQSYFFFLLLECSVLHTENRYLKEKILVNHLWFFLSSQSDLLINPLV